MSLMGISGIAKELVASQEGLYCSWWGRVSYKFNILVWNNVL